MTINSWSAPTKSSSAESTTTGRFFPGSPLRAAPRDASHISPRRGLVDSIFQRCLPEPVLRQSLGVVYLSPGRFPLGAVRIGPLSPLSEFGQEGGERNTTVTSPSSEAIASLTRNSYRGGLDSHVAIV